MSTKTDTTFPESLKEFLFSKDNKFGKDLFAINVQRGREHGLRGYNDYREYYGMQRANSFDDFKEIKPELRMKLAELYNHVDDVDTYAGGLAEDHVEGGQVGPLFAHMMADQFRDIKKGDRFYFENGGTETIFTHVQLDELRKLSLASLICSCTDTDSLQASVFENSSRKNHRIDCGMVYTLDFELWNSQPFEFGFEDTNSWTAWMPSLESNHRLNAKSLQKQRPKDVCHKILAFEERNLDQTSNSVPQIRYQCPMGQIEATDFPFVSNYDGKWTVWFDQSDPGKDGDDLELLETLLNTRKYEICQNPVAIQAQTVAEIPCAETGQVFEAFDVETGLICRAKDQPNRRCDDYRVRYFCPHGSIPKLDVDLELNSWTMFFDIDKDQSNGRSDELR